MGITVSVVQLILAVVALLASALAMWVNTNNEVTKLKSRVYHLEQTDNDLKVVLADIATRLQHIELILAANQIKDK
tara:strand:+ start:106 stop:333 length:228 start_codon:yes stop_codon:yes gene_type:complete